MIKFKRVKIENFMSIESEELFFEDGIFSFEGKNGDGKTTSVLAILQGLFNKNVKSGSDVIEETYNRVTGKPYRIEIEFDKNGTTFLIINNRIGNGIQILKDTVDISKKGIKNQLKQIEDIVGYNYSLFSAFYYLSTTTLQNVFDVSSDNNLVYRFFDIETLKLLEKKLRQQQKTIKTDNKIIDANIASLDKQIKMLKGFKSLDKEKLLNKKMILQDSLIALQGSSDYKKLNILSNELSKIDKDLQDLFVGFKELKSQQNLLKEQQKQLESGICPTCGSKVITQNGNITLQINDLDSNMKAILNKKTKIEDKRKDMGEVYRSLKETLNIKEREVKKELSAIDSQLVIFEQEEKKYKQLKDNIEEIEKQLSLYQEQKTENLGVLRYIDIALGILKSNAISSEYMNSFITLLNSKINELSDFLLFNIKITISENKGKLKYTFIDAGVVKTLNGLSAGEKTRVALITLFAVLETLRILSGNEFNLLVLDELLGVLDDLGLELLQQLLDRYRSKMTVFVVLHHNEIDRSYFDGCYKAVKTNGITKITKEIKWKIILLIMYQNGQQKY